MDLCNRINTILIFGTCKLPKVNGKVPAFLNHHRSCEVSFPPYMASLDGVVSLDSKIGQLHFSESGDVENQESFRE